MQNITDLCRYHHFDGAQNPVLGIYLGIFKIKKIEISIGIRNSLFIFVNKNAKICTMVEYIFFLTLVEHSPPWQLWPSQRRPKPSPQRLKKRQ